MAKAVMKQAEGSPSVYRSTKAPSGNAIVKKKSKTRSFFSSVMVEDFGEVKEFAKEQAMDALRAFLDDIISDTVHKLLRGGGYSGGNKYYSSGRRNTYGSRVPSGSVYNSRAASMEGKRPVTNARNPFDVDEVIITEYECAIEVIDNMYDVAETYPEITVGNFYDFVGLNAPYTANDWGWSSSQIGKLGTRQVRYIDDDGHNQTGWVITGLPRPHHLD